MATSLLTCSACGTDNPIQARFCLSCGQPLSAPAVTPASSSSTGNLPAAHLLKGRYRILDQLGQGGMGAVYKAQDSQLGDRLIAVKEMSQNKLSAQEFAEALDAFKREALMLADLRHPNLPRIYDHFVDGGRWYLVMDFIEGETLEDYLAHKPGNRLPIQEVFEIGIQLCTVLEYLHTHQPPIIFRDLKPANIMRTPDGQLSLIDFGIARHFKPGQSKDTTALGSPGYAAPEQYGKAQTTARADMYSLGATLHQLLSGDDPSESPFLFASLSLSPQFAQLGTLITQMVHADANKRPANMAQIKRELQDIAAGRTSKPSSASQTEKGASLLPTATTPPRQHIALGKLLVLHRGHQGKVNAVAWSHHGQSIASGDEWKNVQVWDATTGQSLVRYRGHSDIVTALAWSPTDDLIASSSYDKTVQVWDAVDGEWVTTFTNHARMVKGLAWSPDGKAIVSVSPQDAMIRIWDARRGAQLTSYTGHRIGVNGVSWSPNGRWIASISRDGELHVWEASTRRKVHQFESELNEVEALVWAPDGTRIATANLPQKTVSVWTIPAGQTLTYFGHAGPVYAVAWSPDGTRITSASGDGTVQVWNATTGRDVHIYRGHTDEVYAVAWSPDGQRIASGSADTTVQVWQAM